MYEFVSPKKSTKELETGTWASKRPKVNDSCTKCKICIKFCPEACIKLDKEIVIDIKHCKGCGICSNVCPLKAIDMEDV